MAASKIAETHNWLKISRSVAKPIVENGVDLSIPLSTVYHLDNNRSSEEHLYFLCPNIVSQSDLDEVMLYLADPCQNYPRCPDTFEEFLQRRKIWKVVLDALNAKPGISYPIDCSSIDFMRSLTSASRLFFGIVYDTLQKREGIYNMKGHVSDPYNDLQKFTKTSLDEMTVRYSKNPDMLGSGGFVTLGKKAYQPHGERSFHDIDKMDKFMKRLIPEDSGIWFNSDRSCQNGIIVAGGFLAACLSGLVEFDWDGTATKVLKGIDIDVFIIMRKFDHNRRKAIVLSLIETLNKTCYKMFPFFSKDTLSTSKCMNIMVQLTRGGPFMKLQIIMRVFETPSHVLYGFDLPACQYMFDGNAVWLTPGALVTSVTGAMLYNEMTMSTSAIVRYIKYMHRYGIKVFIAGVLQDFIDSTISEFEMQEREKPSKDRLYTIAGFLYAVSQMRGVNQNLLPSRSDYGDVGDEEYLYHVFRINSTYKNIDEARRIFHEWSYSPRYDVNRGENKKCFTGAFHPVKVRIHDSLVVD